MPDWVAEYTALSDADRKNGLPAGDLERLAVAAFLIGRDAEIESLRERALRQYLDQGRVDRAIRCGFWIGFHLQNRGEAARSAGWAARLLRLAAGTAISGTAITENPDDARGSGGPITDLLPLHQAVSLMWSGRPGQARPIFDRVLQSAQQCDDPDAFVLAGMGRARCLQQTGDDAGAASSMDEVMVHVVGGRVAPQVVGLAYCSVIDLCLGGFDLLRAQEWTRALTGWVDEQRGMVPYRGTCQVHRAELLQFRGAWTAAADQAEQACGLLAQSGEPALGGAHYRVAELARLRGQHAAAEQAYQRAAALGAEVQPGLALLRLAQHRPQAAVAGLDRALAEDPEAGRRAMLLAARIEIALAVRDPAISDPAAADRAVRDPAVSDSAAADRLAVDPVAAEDAAAELAGLVRPDSPDYLRALAEQAVGAVELARGDRASALTRLRRAWTWWQRVDAPYDAARTRVLIARACGGLGDQDAARMDLDAARAEFERLGAITDLAGLDQLSDRPGSEDRSAAGNPDAGKTDTGTAAAGTAAAGKADSARAAAAGLLSPREREVLRLVATGATNRAIAQQLVLSEKTVARHVANIFGKLEVSSRSAATAFAYQHGLA